MAKRLRSQSISLPLEGVRVDLKRLFTRLGEVAVRSLAAGAMGDFRGATGSIVGALFGIPDAISADASVDVRAWRLIREALAGALFELSKEAIDDRSASLEDERYLAERVDRLVGQDKARVNPDFFSNPASLPILAAIQPIFSDWLRTFSISEQEAEHVTKRLPSYFAAAVHDVWRSDQGTYTPVLNSLSGPLAQAARWEQEWERYRHFLVKQFELPVFEETFPLSAIYVPLRAAYPVVSIQRAIISKPGQESRTLESKIQFTRVVEVEAEIDRWIRKKDASDAIRVVRGGPGSGKSTFARKISAATSENNSIRVLSIQLQHLRLGADLLEAVGEFLGARGANFFSENPLKQPHCATADRPLLLIFDGLDEMAQPGRLAEAQARDFLSELRFFLSRWNAVGCRALALVTGRSAIVQANRNVLRLPEGAELELLPFLISKHFEAAKYSAGWPFENAPTLKIDQREDWWEKYRICKGLPLKGLPETLKGRDLQDLSAEPLLLYLLVLSGLHERRGKREWKNRNEIYDQLFTAVADRRHAFGQALSVRVELNDDFREIMETIAIAAWYGDGRTATTGEIRALTPIHLQPVIDQFLNSEASFTRLIAAFYFQRSETSSIRRDAVEFTHKSFGEYLTARRLVRAVQEISGELSRRSRRYGDTEALTEWFNLTHRAELDRDLLTFIRDEVALNAQDASDWQSALVRMMNECLQNGFSIRLAADEGHRVVERYARNAEESLIALLDACSRTTDQVSHVTWQDKLSAGRLLNRLRSQRRPPARDGEEADHEFSVVLDSMSRLDMREQVLVMQDLSGAQLVDSILDGAKLEAANFEGADLMGASLSDAYLYRARLTQARLWGANLTRADLTYADLSDSDCRDANISATRLRAARLDNANMNKCSASEADMAEATLDGASFQNAKLENTNFSCANADGTIFTGSNMSGANLSYFQSISGSFNKSNLVSANFLESNLKGSDFSATDASGACFDKANLEDTDFRDAKLVGTDLHDSRRKGANFEGAEWGPRRAR